jgi:hypothetical protein
MTDLLGFVELLATRHLAWEARRSPGDSERCSTGA